MNVCKLLSFGDELNFSDDEDALIVDVTPVDDQNQLVTTVNINDLRSEDRSVKEPSELHKVKPDFSKIDAKDLVVEAWNQATELTLAEKDDKSCHPADSTTKHGGYEVEKTKNIPKMSERRKRKKNMNNSSSSSKQFHMDSESISDPCLSAYLASDYNWNASDQEYNNAVIPNGPPELYECLHDEFLRLIERSESENLTTEDKAELDQQTQAFLLKNHNIKTNYSIESCPPLGEIGKTLKARYRNSVVIRPDHKDIAIDKMGCVLCKLKIAVAICYKCLCITMCFDCFKAVGCTVSSLDEATGQIEMCDGTSCTSLSFWGKSTSYRPHLEEGTWYETFARPGMYQPVLNHLKKIFLEKGHKNGKDFIPSLMEKMNKLSAVKRRTLMSHWNIHRAVYGALTVPKMKIGWSTKTVFCRSTNKCRNLASFVESPVDNNSPKCRYCHECAQQLVAENIIKPFSVGGFKNIARTFPKWMGCSVKKCLQFKDV